VAIKAEGRWSMFVELDWVGRLISLAEGRSRRAGIVRAKQGLMP